MALPVGRFVAHDGSIRGHTSRIMFSIHVYMLSFMIVSTYADLHVYIHMYIYIYTFTCGTSLSLSLSPTYVCTHIYTIHVLLFSLSLYIYIYIQARTCVCMGFHCKLSFDSEAPGGLKCRVRRPPIAPRTCGHPASSDLGGSAAKDLRSCHN